MHAIIRATVSDNLYDREGDIIEVSGDTSTVIAAFKKALRDWEPENQPMRSSKSRTRGTKLAPKLRAHAVDFAEGAIRRKWGHEVMSVGTLRHIKVDVTTEVAS